MKQKFLVSALFFVVVSLGSYKLLKNSVGESDIVMENVEALTDGEKPKPTMYSSMHFPVYELVGSGSYQHLEKTDKYTATCWENESAHNPICHSHEASYCSGE